ncbi:hypothetical protein CEXT_389781 [Caerostris extrusa]|uniref:Uncharacterized protein n=1 Tax=Caerostris extrusa TaxID=172846 RepID=A0AAV4V9I1_CAEEX|nr:hypothetical protein CEXT_389781 [Caerostris extrusa]
MDSKIGFPLSPATTNRRQRRNPSKNIHHCRQLKCQLFSYHVPLLKNGVVMNGSRRRNLSDRSTLVQLAKCPLSVLEQIKFFKRQTQGLCMMIWILEISNLDIRCPQFGYKKSMRVSDRSTLVQLAKCPLSVLEQIKFFKRQTQQIKSLWMMIWILEIHNLDIRCPQFGYKKSMRATTNRRQRRNPSKNIHHWRQFKCQLFSYHVPLLKNGVVMNGSRRRNRCHGKRWVLFIIGDEHDRLR